jgi:hypothetical protein
MQTDEDDEVVLKQEGYFRSKMMAVVVMRDEFWTSHGEWN